VVPRSPRGDYRIRRAGANHRVCTRIHPESETAPVGIFPVPANDPGSGEASTEANVMTTLVFVTDDAAE
jgi:hypothetical protein